MGEGKMRYEITAEVRGLGYVKHVLKATDQVSAWERVKKAYPKRNAKVLKIRELERWAR